MKMSSISLEGWKAIFEYGGVLLLFLTFVFGAGLVITANRINRVQAIELRQFRLQIEAEQQKTAEAQRATADAQRAVNEAIVGRLLARQARIDLSESLKPYPSTKAEIWYRDSDPEAWIFAGSVRNDLIRAGWSVPGDLKSIPANRFDGKDLPVWGVTVFNKERGGFFPFSPPPDPSFIAKLLGANGKVDMRLAVLMAGLASTIRKDDSLEQGTFRILVGARDPTQF
jgi:hypothetical protein